MKPEISSTKENVPQNQGWLDRVLRIVIGGSMVGVTAYLLEFDFTPKASWEYYIMLLGIVPIVTGFIGWCPLYNALGVRTCGGSGRNPCGTLPFQISAALGGNPIPDSEIEHSLERSHREIKKAA